MRGIRSAANPRPSGGREKYELLSEGMSYDKVVSILGKPEMNFIPDAKIFEWEFRAGKITVHFKDKVVISRGNTFRNN